MSPEKLWWWSCQAYRRRWVRIARLLKGLNFFLFKCLLPFEAEIQPDIRLDHYALGVVVHPNVSIGRRVRIYHQVTLAAEVPVGSHDRIFIGDDVVIGVGAIVIGRGYESLKIGDGAVIGAGAVVTRDVAPGQIVVGIPGRALCVSASAGLRVSGHD